MRGEYRLSKVRDGAMWFAKVAVVAEAAASLFIVDGAAPPYFQAAVHRGIGIAAAEHARRGGRPCRIVVEYFLYSNVDTNDNVAECAAAIATWIALGHDEQSASLRYESPSLACRAHRVMPRWQRMHLAMSLKRAEPERGRRVGLWWQQRVARGRDERATSSLRASSSR